MGQPLITLDATLMARRGILAAGTRTRGVISWTNEVGVTTASVSYEADLTDPEHSLLRLRFSSIGPDGARRQVDQMVPVTTTRPGLGGLRYWFLEDSRRVAQLRLAPGGVLFQSRATQD